MTIDHVVVAVTDLEAAAQLFEERHGLVSQEGGRHPAWGTANRIVPLGSAYLELIAVVDEEIAAATSVGRWVGSAATAEGSPLGWVVRPDDLTVTAARLGLGVHEGSRATPSGEIVRWRSAGMEVAVEEPALPFFIEWESAFPGSTASPNPHSITRLELSGDDGKLAEWLGDHDLPIEVRPGDPGPTAIVLTGPAGEVVLERR